MMIFTLARLYRQSHHRLSQLGCGNRSGLCLIERAASPFHPSKGTVILLLSSGGVIAIVARTIASALLESCCLYIE